MLHTSHIELSRSALKKNIRFIRKQIGPKVIFSSVIKGNAYGHGIALFVPLAEQCGIRHFSVFSADEALAALQARAEQSQIMIMGAMDNDQIGWAVENGVSFYIFENDRLKVAQKTAKRLGISARVHLELETGLHRTGLQGAEVRRALDFVAKHPSDLAIDGVCTHYAGAETIGNYVRIQNQIISFSKQCAAMVERGYSFGPGYILRHTACSAAAFTYPKAVMDMVRIGIAQYGFWPSKETEIYFFTRRYPKRKKSQIKDPLARVIKWMSRVMSVKRIKRGDFVGYGTSSLATRSQKVAAIPVGYFHGYSRDLSNIGHVLIRGRRAPVVGTVNMNMMLVDVTDVPGAAKGDEVVIIGRQNDNTISVGAFGEMTRIINYEILVRLPSEIPRVVVD